MLGHRKQYFYIQEQGKKKWNLNQDSSEWLRNKYFRDWKEVIHLPNSSNFKLQNQQQAFCSLCFVRRRGLEVIFRIYSFITEKFVRNNHYKLAISQTIIWKITLRTVRGPYGKNNNSCWVFFRCLTDKSRGVVCNSYSDVFLAQEHGC